jgi:hypothetical protein
MKTIATIAALMLAPMTAHADTFNNTGNELKAHCTEENFSSKGFCLGFVQGTWNGMIWTVAMLDKKLCVPENVTTGQMRDFALAYIERHPESRDQNAIVLLTTAVAESWPCK